MINALNKKILSMYNSDMAGTKLNNQQSEDEIERSRYYWSESKLKDSSQCLALVKDLVARFDTRINNLKEIRSRTEKAGIEFRYASELNFLEEIRGL